MSGGPGAQLCCGAGVSAAPAAGGLGRGEHRTAQSKSHAVRLRRDAPGRLEERALRGGLGVATIAACGGFAAICGSSVATAATFSKVAYPEMRQHGYPQSFATGVIAAGGSLGIMIPPSTVFAVVVTVTVTPAARAGGIMHVATARATIATRIDPDLKLVSAFSAVGLHIPATDVQGT